MSSNPVCSVIMSVFNGSDYLTESIDSILNQSFQDFELIIINDASTDSSETIIRSYQDERIKLINNETNVGLAASLNIALKKSQGEFIARMDDDDIAMEDRLSEQITFLQQNPEVGIVGSYAELYGSTSGLRIHALSSDELKIRTLFSCQFCHPTVMFRKALIDGENVKYDESFKTAQDFELWSRIVSLTNFATIPKVLLKYRVHSNQISIAKRDKQIEATSLIYAKILNNLAIYPTDNDIELHNSLANLNFYQDELQLKYIGAYLINIIESNQKKRIFPIKPFEKFLAEYYYNILQNSTEKKINRLKYYEMFKFQTYYNPKFRRLKQLLK